MKFVRTVKYHVRVNGDLTDEIVPERGLRQGDPLSPYLFLICAEALSCLLNSDEERGETVGIRVCQGAPSINHLLFADDSLLLFKIENGSAEHLQNILSWYEDCSGQTINKDKSAIMLSRNTPQGVKEAFMSQMDINSEARNEKIPWVTCLYGQIQSSDFYLSERKSVEENTGLEREAAVKGRERCAYQGNCTGHSDICYVLFRSDKDAM